MCIKDVLVTGFILLNHLHFLLLILSNFFPNILWIMQKHMRSMRPNESLVYARTEIENAPVVFDDPDLYAPLFRNVSTFKRYFSRLRFYWSSVQQCIKDVNC